MTETKPSNPTDSPREFQKILSQRLDDKFSERGQISKSTSRLLSNLRGGSNPEVKPEDKTHA